jgi:hypothetical protein
MQPNARSSPAEAPRVSPPKSRTTIGWREGSGDGGEQLPGFGNALHLQPSPAEPTSFAQTAPAVGSAVGGGSGRMTVEVGVEARRECVETGIECVEPRIHPTDERVEPSIDVVETSIHTIEPAIGPRGE